MISELIPYGGAIYWLLLFFGIYMVTLFANQETSTLRPNIWAGLTAFTIWGFTGYSPDTTEFLMGVLTYFLVGVVVVIMKWDDLIIQIRALTKVLEPLSYSSLDLRNLAWKTFKPSNSTNEMLKLPPDPYEFRTKLTLWFFYWPAFTVFKPLAVISSILSNKLWKLFSRISKSVYED